MLVAEPVQRGEEAELEEKQRGVELFSAGAHLRALGARQPGRDAAEDLRGAGLRGGPQAGGAGGRDEEEEAGDGAAPAGSSARGPPLRGVRAVRRGLR